MKQVPFLIALLAGATAAAFSAKGQVSRQILSFSLDAQFSTNKFSTNHATGAVTTNQILETAPISTPTVVRDIAVDLYGADYTNWTNATLLRETDADGHEGIFLFKPKPLTNVNVSSFFSTSFSNDFTSGVPGNFTPITNFNNVPELSADPNYYDFPPGPAANWSNITNFVFNVTTPVQAARLHITKTGVNTFITTNSLISPPASVSLCYVSLNTANLQFSLIASGSATTTNLMGNLPHVPTLFSNQVQYLQLNFAVGTYRANLGTNLLDPDPADFVSGPAHVNLPFGTSPPVFSTNLATEVFP
jgi:hypothetical protein